MQKRHRHFVAVPAMLLVLAGVTGLMNMLPLRAETFGSEIRFVADAESREIEVGDLHAVLRPGSKLTSDSTGRKIELLSGHASFTSPSSVEADVNDAVTQSLGGAFTLMRDGSAATVVALKHALSVHVNGSTTFIVTGEQLTWDGSDAPSVSMSPSDWRQQELLSLPKAKESYGARLDREKYEALVSSETDPDHRRLRLLTLAEGADRLDDDAEAALGADILSDAVLSERIGMWPPVLALSTGKPLPSDVIEAWPDAFIGLWLRDGTGALAILRQAEVLPAAYESLGYPVQAERWNEALSRVHSNLSYSFASVDAEIRTPDGTSSEPVKYAEEDLLQETHRVLLEGGALLSAATDFAVDAESQTVRVDGIFIAEQGTDVPYAFTYDPVRRLATAIVRDGVPEPNEVPIDVLLGH